MDEKNGLSMSSIDFNAKSDQKSKFAILRSVIPHLDDTDSFQKLWIELSYGDLTEYSLKEGDKIKIKLNDLICPVCHNPREKLSYGTCNRCHDPDDPFRIRLSCQFQEPTSPLEVNGNCQQDQPPCGFESNVKYCHSRYVLYFARIGNKFKTGISRYGRRGGYKQRLIEQGAQEAIIVSFFPSLMDALNNERKLIDMGVASRIQTDEKLEDFKLEDSINLLDIFPIELFEELFEQSDIFYQDFYPDFAFPNLKLNTENSLSGMIAAVIGKYLVVTTEDKRFHLVNTNNYWNRTITKLEINKEVII